ncbi:MAG: HEPN domain-containing protein [Ignavibacteriae bacterium]|nr:HEPN domain-containing protein [Ignavibacteriota bacterium]
MNQGDISALMSRRLQQANDAVTQAETLLGIGQSFGAANRAYYAMFYATLAILLSKNLGSSKHTGVLALFDKNFVRTNEVETTWSKMLHRAFTLRNQGDYDDWMSVSENDARLMCDDAKEFVSWAHQWLRKRNFI